MSTTASSWSVSRALELTRVDAPAEVRLELGRPEELLTRLYPTTGLGGVTVDGPLRGQLGDVVRLVVSTLVPGREVVATGRLAWARHRTHRGLTESFGVDLLDQGDGARRLLAFAQESLDAAAVRAARRVPVSWPVKTMHGGLVRRDVLCDLSLGGALIRTTFPAETGEVVTIAFRPPGAWLALQLSGRVAWHQVGEDASGMGVHFEGLEPKQKERLEKAVRALTEAKT